MASGWVELLLGDVRLGPHPLVVAFEEDAVGRGRGTRQTHWLVLNDITIRRFRL